jgi:hypothetical protein
MGISLGINNGLTSSTRKTNVGVFTLTLGGQPLTLGGQPLTLGAQNA